MAVDSTNSNVVVNFTPTTNERIGAEYSDIGKDTDNVEVSVVIGYLNKRFNGVLAFGSIIKVEKQHTIKGINYRISLTFDSYSSAYYAIITKKDPSRSYSITSVSLNNVPKVYSFSNPLSAAQISQFTYLSTISNSIARQIP